jgi:hypothetical protein
MYRVAFCLLALLVAGGCSGSDATDPMSRYMHPGVRSSVRESSPEVLAGLAQIRQVTAVFHDLDKATAAGYTVWSPDPATAPCPSSAEGKMGYHRVNVSLRGDANIDLLHPEMLLYERRADGSMHLVGVEYLVFKDAWEREQGIDAPPPEVLGQPLLLSHHTFGNNTNLIWHYELHVWTWTSNPLGMFYPWNPTVTC